MIIECVSLWKNKHNIFGLYIRPHQIRVESYTDEELAKFVEIEETRYNEDTEVEQHYKYR